MGKIEAEKLAVILPCFNEQEVLPDTLRILSGFLAEMIRENRVSADSIILAVDDGSTDRTWEIIRNSSQSGSSGPVRGISLSRNFGHQYAILAGLFTCDADLMVTLDADLQDDYRCIREMVEHYRRGCDIVYGVRKKRETDSFFKRTSARMFYRLMTFLGCRIIPDHADFRLMSRRAVETLRQFPERNVFLRGMIPLIGGKSAVVYYDRRKRTAGVSKYPLGKMLSFAWDGITSMSEKPIALIAQFGLFLMLICLFLAGFCIVKKFWGYTVPGWTSLCMILCGFSAIQFLAISIVGQYVGKIYKECKARPLFIVQDFSGSFPEKSFSSSKTDEKK